MKKISIAIVAVSLLFLTACEKVIGDGPVVTETRNVVDFAGVDLRVSADVYYSQSPVFKVEVKAQQNILDVMETYVSNNKLVVKYKNNVNVRSHEPIIVTISSPLVNHLRISGSGSIRTSGLINTGSMELDISGSGNIRITELHTQGIDANISGSGELDIDTGTATHETLRISGSGNIDLTNVTATSASTHTSGSGDMRVNASQSLTVKISGSGSVYYKGNPVINTSISGSGKVLQF